MSLCGHQGVTYKCMQARPEYQMISVSPLMGTVNTICNTSRTLTWPKWTIQFHLKIAPAPRHLTVLFITFLFDALFCLVFLSVISPTTSTYSVKFTLQCCANQVVINKCKRARRALRLCCLFSKLCSRLKYCVAQQLSKRKHCSLCVVAQVWGERERGWS